MHCTEIAKFVLAEDDSVETWPSTPVSPLSPLTPLTPLSPTSRRAHGRNKSCSGYEVQESKNVYLVNAWDLTEEEDESAMKYTEEPLDFTTPPNSPAVNLEYRIHVQFTVEPYTALSAPLTEIVLWTVKKGASRAKVEELLTSLMRVVNTIPSSKGLYKAGWGPVMENEDQYVVLIGWENMEAFHSAVRNSPEGRALLDQLDEHTSRHLRHVTLNTE